MSSATKLFQERSSCRLRTSIIVLVVTLTIGFSTTNVLALCAQFPNSEFGITLTHERAKKYVNQKLDGNWTPYISHLEKQLQSVNDIVRQGKSARVKRNGESVVLNGNQLKDYVEMSRARLEVVRCLASERRNMRSASAYTPPIESDEEPIMEVQPRRPDSAELASRVELEVSTVCSNGISKFRVKNRGADWSSASSFSIYRIEDNNKYRVSSRRMRLKNGQVVSFTVKKSHNPSGSLGLFVDPAWYARPFNYDATLTCQ